MSAQPIIQWRQRTPPEWREYHLKPKNKKEVAEWLRYWRKTFPDFEFRLKPKDSK